MSARDVVRRIPTYLVCALLCFAMFDVPSAYAYWRGVPWGVALAVGLVVFPGLPVAWHIYSERKAKRAEKPKPRKTKGIERFLFRTIVVAVVALGGLIAIVRGRVGTAMKNDGLWFVPTSLGSLEPDSKLLDKVPPSAQMVVWVRPTEDAKALVGKVAPGIKVTEIVAAGRVADKAAEAIVVERGDLIIPLIERVQLMVMGFTAKNGITIPWGGSVVSDTGGVKTWSTPGWVKEIGTGRAPVIDLIRRAPEDAFIVAVARIPAKATPTPTLPTTLTPPTTPTPTTPSPTTPTPTTPTPTTPTAPMTTPPIKSTSADEVVAQGVTAVMWARAPRKRLEIDMTIETASEAAAGQLLDEANAEIAKSDETEGKEMACWRDHSDELFMRREGAKLHARMAVDLDGIKGLVNCLDMAKK